jgi:diketogulonate reductase-like aldo/keto reductase
MLPWNCRPVTGCSGPSLSPSTAETWSALEGCVAAGLTRSIGVSNFSITKIQQLLDSPGLKIRPAVLQVRCAALATAVQQELGSASRHSSRMCLVCSAGLTSWLVWC